MNKKEQWSDCLSNTLDALGRREQNLGAYIAAAASLPAALLFDMVECYTGFAVDIYREVRSL